MSISKKPFILPFLGVLLIPLVNCGGGPHAVDEKFYLIATNIKLPYWQAAATGLSRAAGSLKVKSELVGPDTYDPKAQQEEFQRVMKLKPTGILVSPADPKLMEGEINAAIAAGIPVITVDSDAPASKRLLFIGTNNYQAGLMGGQLAVKQMQGKGNVVVFSMPEQMNLNARLRGYQDAFAGHPQMKIAEVVNVQGDPRKAFDTTTEIVEKRKNKVDGFVCLEASAGKEVAEVLDRNHIKDKPVIAMDTAAGTLEWIQKGVIVATIAQKPFTMAYYGLKMLDDVHHNKPKSLDVNFAQDSFATLPTFVDTGATLIDKSNVEAFIKGPETASP